MVWRTLDLAMDRKNELQGRVVFTLDQRPFVPRPLLPFARRRFCPSPAICRCRVLSRARTGLDGAFDWLGIDCLVHRLGSDWGCTDAGFSGRLAKVVSDEEIG